MVPDSPQWVTLVIIIGPYGLGRKRGSYRLKKGPRSAYRGPKEDSKVPIRGLSFWVIRGIYRIFLTSNACLSVSDKKNYDTVAVLRNVHTCVHCVKRKKTKVTN